MSYPVAQIVLFRVRPDVNAEDIDSEDGKRFVQARDLIVKHGGVTSFRYGVAEEDKSLVITVAGMFIFSFLIVQQVIWKVLSTSGLLTEFVSPAWKTLQQRLDFTKTEDFKKVNELLAIVLVAKPVIYNVPASDDLTKITHAPVTEIYERFYLEADAEEKGPALLAASEDFNKSLVTQKGTHGAQTGWSHEVIEKDGEKGKALTLLAGWDSVEAHSAARETTLFADTIHLLKEPAPKSGNMFHVKLQKFANAEF
jgi:hypothetical protein